MAMHELEEELYISHSTLLNDLKGVQDSLSPFHLELSKENNRLKITGLEIDKRRCLAENSLYLDHVRGHEDSDQYIDMQRISYIKNVLLEIFMANQYYISDTDFNNAILTLNIMIHRVQKRFFIKREELAITDDIDKEILISRKIFEKMRLRFLCNIPAEEIAFFALYLKGQEICKNHDIISQEMDQFIGEVFVKIKHNYGIDFTNNISLRISIALHCIPLLIRIKYHMQIQSPGLSDIKQSFPLGYEIASYFVFLLRDQYGETEKIAEDEIALIAAHFYGTLLELRQKKQKIRVLILSSLKMSMTVLLRSILMKWFSREISDLEFIHAGEVTEQILDSYDVYLTTEKNDFYENGLAMYINLFPTENDRKNIKLLLDGFSDLEDVVQIFQEKLFLSLQFGTKQAILKELSGKAEEEYGLSRLHEAVLEREKIGSTFFSQGIAIPHPIRAIASDTFVAVCVVQKPVVWDEEGNLVQVIMMVHIGNNNPRSFQLWDYFSRIFEEKRWVENVVALPNFENFTVRLKELLTSKFAKSE